MRAFDSGLGENVTKWCLCSGGIRYKSPVPRSGEVTGGFGSEAVLKMVYLFFQRSGILGGHSVASDSEKTHFAGFIRIPYV
jgi:hypothetical protein